MQNQSLQKSFPFNPPEKEVRQTLCKVKKLFLGFYKNKERIKKSE